MAMTPPASENWTMGTAQPTGAPQRWFCGFDGSPMTTVPGHKGRKDTMGGVAILQGINPRTWRVCGTNATGPCATTGAFKRHLVRANGGAAGVKTAWERWETWSGPLSEEDRHRLLRRVRIVGFPHKLKQLVYKLCLKRVVFRGDAAARQAGYPCRLCTGAGQEEHRFFTCPKLRPLWEFGWKVVGYVPAAGPAPPRVCWGLQGKGAERRVAWDVMWCGVVWAAWLWQCDVYHGNPARSIEAFQQLVKGVWQNSLRVRWGGASDKARRRMAVEVGLCWKVWDVAGVGLDAAGKFTLWVDGVAWRRRSKRYRPP